MIEDILTTMYYLAFVLIGLPSIYFLSSSSSNKEIKGLAIKIYPLAMFLLLLITVLIYGESATKKAIGYAFGSFIFFLFNAALGFGLMILLIVVIVYIFNLGHLFNSIKKKLSSKQIISKIFKKRKD